VLTLVDRNDGNERREDRREVLIRVDGRGLFGDAGVRVFTEGNASASQDFSP
jgi:hypothetical protein